jgi:hypothetical protein
MKFVIPVKADYFYSLIRNPGGVLVLGYCNLDLPQEDFLRALMQAFGVSASSRMTKAIKVQ